jgi:hypothetical protein
MHFIGRRLTLDEVDQDHKLHMVEEYAAYDRALAASWGRP